MDKKKVHFIAIGGIGMSALAKILLERGYEVSGSDMKATAVVEKLSALGAKISLGHAGANLPDDCQEVIFSSAIREDNPELVKAKALGIPCTHRGELLARLFNPGRGLAVAGAHGKTTTSGMIGHILELAGKKPHIAIGGILPLIESNAKNGENDLWIVEADESDGSFLKLTPERAIITNIEPEHMDYYGDETTLKDAFLRFAADSGECLLCFDDPRTRELAQKLPNKLRSYGLTSDDVDITAKNIVHQGQNSEADVVFGGETVAHLRLAVPGDHNVLNAIAALYCAYLEGIPFAQGAEHLASFSGTGRRFEILYDRDGIVVVDDYAHHPTEVKATIKAAKDGGYRRVVVVFQPHRYTRVKELYAEFGKAFFDADLVVIDEIYSAWEDKLAGVSSELIVTELKQNGVDPRYLKSQEEIVDFLMDTKQDGDILLLMGAGNIRETSEQLCQRLAEESK